jgi:hypothetical protein
MQSERAFRLNPLATIREKWGATEYSVAWLTWPASVCLFATALRGRTTLYTVYGRRRIAAGTNSGLPSLRNLVTRTEAFDLALGCLRDARAVVPGAVPCGGPRYRIVQLESRAPAE